MSGEQPERPIWVDASLRPRRSAERDATAGHPVATVAPADVAPASPASPAPPAPRGPLNALAVVSVALGVLLSPLAAVFGHIALGQIARSRRLGGRNERGRRAAGTAIALGWLWLVAYLIIGAAVWVALGGVV